MPMPMPMPIPMSMPQQAWNFAAGPARLPDAVLQRLRTELWTHGGDGASLCERPFSSASSKALRTQAAQRLAQLLDLPDAYRVLFLAGGAMQQFALLPMNLAQPGQTVGYVDTGYWSRRAWQEGARLRPALSVEPDAQGRISVGPDWAYCHITTNETAEGRCWPQLAQIQDLAQSSAVPWVADATSDFLSAPLEVQRLGLLYASAQKNVGVAGLCVVVVREDLLQRSPETLPPVFSYLRQSEAGSCINTPPLLALQVAAMVFDWIAESGGLPVMAAQRQAKAAAVQGAIEASDGFYRQCVAAPWRSPVTLCWHLPDEARTEAFLIQAQAAGLHHLRGHPHVGGIRASLYNAMPLQGAQDLAAFMREFAQRYG